jgi:hypothetical protein
MKDLHPITIAIIILISLYLLTGCQSSKSFSDQCADSKYNTPTGFAKFLDWFGGLTPQQNDDSYYTDPYGLKRWNERHGGRPTSAINYSTPSRPSTWRDQRKNPEQRGATFWFK